VTKAFRSATRVGTTEQAGVAPLPSLPITVREAAAYLGITEKTFRRLCRTSALRAFKAGGQWRVYPAELTDYIMKQLQKS
jgi:excisionase family DNA binding protein